jgi:hypothetical protein
MRVCLDVCNYVSVSVGWGCVWACALRRCAQLMRCSAPPFLVRFMFLGCCAASAVVVLLLLPCDNYVYVAGCLPFWWYFSVIRCSMMCR